MALYVMDVIMLPVDAAQETSAPHNELLLYCEPSNAKIRLRLVQIEIPQPM